HGYGYGAQSNATRPPWLKHDGNESATTNAIHGDARRASSDDGSVHAWHSVASNKPSFPERPATPTRALSLRARRTSASDESRFPKTRPTERTFWPTSTPGCGDGHRNGY